MSGESQRDAFGWRFGSNQKNAKIAPTEVRAAADAVRREAEALAECVRQIDDAGVQVKDLDEGLLDFPAEHEGEEVLLCWKVGEPEVAYWHGLDEGFAGRKPLPF